MEKLEKLISEFELSEESRKHILAEVYATQEHILADDVYEAPQEFVEIARVALAGHFSVKKGDKTIKVFPTCIEFYYHEEVEGGIKDWIVYHKNPQKTSKTSPNKSVFLLGSLHNHVSGIDITFEKGDNPETAIRASFLIREFQVEGDENEVRSTKLYDVLYQQSSVFEGISVKWEDGQEPVDFVTDVRKNVAEYEKDNTNGTTSWRKKTMKENPDRIPTANKTYVQDPRKWQFRRK